MNEAGYKRIVEALETGRRALARARLTAGLLRFLGVVLATGAGLVVGTVLQKALDIHSVPLATGLSLLGAGLIVFALVRWVVVPLVRMPDRDAFVAMIERRFPKEKNLIVNAYQLGDADRSSQGAGAPELVEVVVSQAEKRIQEMNIRKWRDPAPDRPFLWAGTAAILVMGLMAAISPSLLRGAWTQVLRPSDARPPEVTLQVSPGDLEVDRGSDVPIRVSIHGTDEAPVLRFRERHGAWRRRDFSTADLDLAQAKGHGAWETVLPQVDRVLEYRVEAPRAESDVFTIRVRDMPRLAGFRAHMDYPDYTGLSTETLTSGSGDLSALRGTRVDLHVLTNRSLPEGYLDWRPDGDAEEQRLGLSIVDPTTFMTRIEMTRSGSYAVVLLDEDGSERLRSPRYRIDPAEDRWPHLTLHFPQEDHDLTEDMMERIVADAADDFGFHSVRVHYRVDDGEESAVSFRPFTPGQTEFRLDTLWDLDGLDLLPGSVVSYYLEVRDNDTVSGPKAVRSPVRRVSFPTLGELYEEVAKDHQEEIDTLSDVRKDQEDVRKKLEELSNDLKRGREMDWDLRQDVERNLQKQQNLEEQVSEVVERLNETLSKATGRAQMNEDLLQKMSKINELLETLGDEDMKRSFRELSRALDRMDRNAVRRALEDMQVNQEQMLRGMDRTIELLEQIRREEQVADVVQRTDEIARLQDQIAEEMEKLAKKDGLEGADPTEEGRPGEEGEPGESGDESPSESSDAESQESGDPQDGESESGESQDGEPQDGEPKDGEPQDGEPQDGEPQDSAQTEPGEASSDSKEEEASSEQKEGNQEQASSEEGSESESGDSENSSESASGSKPQSQQQQSTQQKQLEALAQDQKKAEEMVEELKRLLKTLKKLNEEENSMAKSLEDMEKGKTLSDLQQNMQQSQQNMAGGKPDKAAPYTFKAREEANRLAGMAQDMQQQMASSQEESNIELMESIIKGLIDISAVQEQLATSPGADHRLLAQRQFDLTERAEGWEDSLQVVMQQSFSLTAQDQDQMDKTISRMERATEQFELGNRTKAEHEAREGASDVNETIVQLMQSHQQMCSSQGQGGGDAMSKMQGLSEGQQGLNQSTRELMERLAGKERLSMTDEQRMAQLAAQQDMIRQGLEELTEELTDAEDLLGDMGELAEEMKGVEQELREHQVDPRVLERQQQILGRMLDAQRSIRQQEMSPERESRTATLAERPSPPPLPESLLERQRTLEEDVLRGANDRYPSQYRKLVEEYFRALARENRAP